MHITCFHSVKKNQFKKRRSLIDRIKNIKHPQIIGKVFEEAFGTGQMPGDGHPTLVNLLQKGVPEYTDMQSIDKSQLQGQEYPF